MKVIAIVIGLIWPFASMGQRPHIGWQPIPLIGEVKRIRISSEVLPNSRELRIRLLDTSSYTVDSFNRDGLEIASYQVKSGVVVSAFQFGYEFNFRGNIVQQYYSYLDEITFVDKRIVTIRRAFEYDTTNNIIKETFYGAEGEFGRCRKYTYSSGLLTTLEDSILQGVTRVSYKYDDRGKVVEKVEDYTYMKDRKTTTNYHYDAKGNKFSEIWSSGLHSTTRNFDKQGNEVREGEYFIEYIYDKYGNWIRRLEGLGDGSVRIEVREIEYY